MLGNYLRAQETSPTLSIAYAGIGDEGALEIAHFLVQSKHLRRLDLRGNGITSTGALHLAKAVKQNHTLESLVLKHNKIGEEGEAGLAAICRALCGNETLRHLDLRHNTLTGSTAATHLGEMLKANTHLSHLEISWNALEPEGGQVLMDHISMNTTLFDCQLTSCGIAQETLLGIAQLLLRNRKAKAADLQAGPYEAHVARQGLPFNAEPPVDRGITDMKQEQIASPLLDPQNLVVCDDRTNEFMMRLLKWQQSPGRSANDMAHCQELYEYLAVAQRQAAEDREVAQNADEHLSLLGESFRDRELRYRRDIAAAQDKLLDYANERQGLMGIFTRYTEELNLLREQNVQVHQELESDQRRYEAEEARAQGDLQLVTAERKELTKRLEHLEEQRDWLEKETNRLNGRSMRLREGIVLLRP